jgi:transposase
MIDVDAIRQRYAAVSGCLDERGRRRFAAAEAKTAGYGGIAAVSRVTGIAASTIGRGLKELATSALTSRGVRRPGGGRKPAVARDPQLLRDLQALVEPTTRGDPERPLRWTSKSLRRLEAELRAMGHRVGRTLVGELLHQLGFSLQANAKIREGESHPDRAAQFEHINAQVSQALARLSTSMRKSAKRWPKGCR